MRPSTRKVGIANGGTSNAKYVTQLLFRQLSAQSRKADTFQDFPNSLMSVGKTANKGTVSVFTKDGVNVFKEEDILIKCKGEPILIGVRDGHGRYQIPLMQQRGQWQPWRPVHPNKKGKHSNKPTASTISCRPNKPSNGCMPYVVTQ